MSARIRSLLCRLMGHPVERLDIELAKINPSNGFSASVVCARCGGRFVLTKWL